MTKPRPIPDAVRYEAAVLREATRFYTTAFLGRGQFVTEPQPSLAAALAAKAKNPSLMVYAERVGPAGGTSRSILVGAPVLSAYETLYGQSAV